MAVLRRFTDIVEPISIDEAFLDVTAGQRSMGSGERIARRLKDEIRRETSLTASVGVASNKLVAKTASDMGKPDGLVVVPAGSEAAFLAPLPVRRLWGVGPKMEERLIRAGIHTIGELARIETSALERRLGTHGHDLVLLARGIDERPVHADPGEAKSIGAEHTYGEDVADLPTLRATLLSLADTVAARLRGHEVRARTITLKYRDETFRTLTRAHTLAHSTDSAAVVFDTAWAAFVAVHGTRRVRLLGIYTSGFGERQLELFRDETPPIDRLTDIVADKLGRGVVTRASLLGKTRRGEPRG
jgi:DNA polymerase-4